VVPIHAFPVINTSEFPKFIDFSLVPVGEKYVATSSSLAVLSVVDNKMLLIDQVNEAIEQLKLVCTMQTYYNLVAYFDLTNEIMALMVPWFKLL